MAKNSGPSQRDLGLRGRGSGKGDAPRNTGPQFRDNFPESMTGNVAGFAPTGYLGVSRKVYGRQQVTRLGEAPHFGQTFTEYS